MDVSFLPIIAVLLIWLFVGFFSSALARMKKAGNAKTASHPRQAPEASKEPAPAAESPPAERSSWSTLQPLVSPGNQDDSLYRGSLNAVTGEGEDPCHEEQFSVLNQAENIRDPEAAVSSASGLHLSWTGSEIVRGFVMGEILKRKS